MSSAKFANILRLLAENEVEAVVVGMLAGVLQGAPLTTGDVDIVHRRTPENVRRLLKVLVSIRAVYRGDPRRLVPTESHLLGAGHQLLESDLGDLDCLGTIDGGRGYEELVGSAFEVKVTEDKSIAVLGLEALIEVKARAGRAKDLAAIPVLRATLEEARRRP